MIIRIARTIRQLRRKKSAGIGLLTLFATVAVIGNALTFYAFDRGAEPAPSIGDAFWYSIVSITTIGYGDVAAESTGARIGTAIFVIVLGLSAFTAALSLGIDAILEFQYKERAGMGSPAAKNHLLIINFPDERRVRQIIGEYVRDPHHKNAEIILVTDRIETLPFSLPNVAFVRGSPLEEETYLRAHVEDTSQAIVLSTGYDDPNSDSVGASIVSIIEHLNPTLPSVAECLNAKHSLLFKGAKNVSLVYTFRISNNLIVQEAQDPGVTSVAQAITSNEIDGTLVSTEIAGLEGSPTAGTEVATRLLDHGVTLVGVVRGKDAHVRFQELELAEADRLVYISSRRYDWATIRSFLS